MRYFLWSAKLKLISTRNLVGLIGKQNNSAASGLVNDGVETLRGYGRIQTALDVCLQSIMRRAGPFYKPPSSTSTSKPGEDRGSSCAVASAYKVEQKRRSRGKGRLIKGLSSHPTPPPVSVLPKKPATLVSTAKHVRTLVNQSTIGF